MENENDKIRDMLTPSCPVNTSPDFTDRVVDAIRNRERRSSAFASFFRSKASEAAVVCALLVVSGAVAGIWYAQTQERDAEPVEAPAPEVVVEETAPEPVLEPLVYEDETLANITRDISHRYGCDVEFASEGVKHTRLHLTIAPDASLEEVVDILARFDKIDAVLSDNTIYIK